MTKRSLCLLLCVFLAFLTACAEEEPEKSESSGTTTKSETPKAETPEIETPRLQVRNKAGELLDAKIYLRALGGEEAILTQGEEKIAELPTGSKRVIVRAEGYLGREFNVAADRLSRITLLKLVDLNIRVEHSNALAIPHVPLLVERQYEPPVQLFEPGSDDPLAGYQPDRQWQVASNAKGEITLAGMVPLANYKITPMVAGFGDDAVFHIKGPSAENNEPLTIKAKANTWVCGKLTQNEVKDFSKGGVSFFTMENKKGRNSMALCNRHGSFALASHAGERGKFAGHLAGRADGKEFAVQRFIGVEEGHILDLGEIELIPLWVVKGVVLRDGKPVENALLRLQPIGGATAMTNAQGEFVFQGLMRSTILDALGEFRMQIYDGQFTSVHIVSEEVRNNQDLTLDVGEAEKRVLRLDFQEAGGKETQWRIASTEMVQAPAITSSGNQALSIFPGKYRLFAQAGEKVAMLAFEIVAGDDEKRLSVTLVEGVVITPKLGGALENATVVLLDSNSRPLGLEPIVLFNGKGGEHARRKSWRVPMAKYKARAGLLGRNINKDADASEGDITIVFE